MPQPPDRPTAMNNTTGKRLLALVRDGDYAHPGEEEANRLLFAGLARHTRRRVLDAGCGGGGTAAWVQAQGYGTVTGMEIDAATARLARERHPEVTIVGANLERAAAVRRGPFDLIYSMTALYAVPDQRAALTQLGVLAAPRAELRLLEYSDPQGRFAAATQSDPGWSWWRPLDPRGLPGLLTATGWELESCRDLEPEFIRWYAGLCRRIEAKREAITRAFGREWHEFAAREYAGILALVRAGDLGGMMVQAVATSGASRPAAPLAGDG